MDKRAHIFSLALRLNSTKYPRSFVISALRILVSTGGCANGNNGLSGTAY